MFEPDHLASPDDQSYIHSHNIYMDQDVLLANMAGMVEKVNKLISVTPVKTRYNEEVSEKYVVTELVSTDYIKDVAILTQQRVQVKT